MIDQRAFSHTLRVVIAFAAASFFFAPRAQAASKIWVGPTSLAFWNTPDNWSPASVPGTGDDAFITPSDNILRQIIYQYTGPPVTQNSLTLNLAGGPGGSLSEPLFFSMDNYVLSASTESVGNSNFAGNGVALFLQSGGENNVGSGGLSLGVTPSDFGTYALSGGTATIDGSVYVGGTSGGAGGVGDLGVSGSGVLTVNGTLVAYNTTDPYNGPTAINFSGGTINAAALNFNGMPSLLNWSGGTLNINSSVSFDSAAAGSTTGAAFGSALTLGFGQTLRITGSETLGGTGSFGLTVNSGGKHTVTNDINLTHTGTLTLNAGGSATAGVQLLTGNSGTVDLSGGGTMTVGIVGEAVPADGSVLIGTGGTVAGTGTIVGAVVNDGGTVQPGFTAGLSQTTGPGLLHITGPYAQAAGGMLKIEIGGTARGTQYDALLASGQASLGGTLQVSLINSFSPALNDSFDILDASSISGPFTTLFLPSLGASFTWNTSQLYTAGVLRVVASPGLPGDFNHNGTVEAGDYVVWREGLNTTHSPGDYGVWRAHFGRSAGTASSTVADAATHTAVPEPASIAMLAVCMTLLFQSRFRCVMCGQRFSKN